jgi:hypothetical protein
MTDPDFDPYAVHSLDVGPSLEPAPPPVRSTGALVLR